MLETCRKWEVYESKILLAERAKTSSTADKGGGFTLASTSTKVPRRLSTGAENQVSTGFSLELGLVIVKASAFHKLL